MAHPQATDHGRNQPVRLHAAPERERSSFGVPSPLTSFIGRDHEILGIAKLLSDPAIRLVTLTGPGGVGKTRLALKAVDQSAEHFTDGVAFVALAPVTDPALVASTVASVLGIPHMADREPKSMVQQFLADRQLLLVLDNLEHLLPAAVLTSEWLETCPSLTILVTSRARLSVSGEHCVDLAPLAVPDLEKSLSPESIATNPSVRLFVERACAAKSEFSLTTQNSAAVAAICARLDGLPLALELAAARTVHLPPATLLQRLDERLRILTGGARDQPERFGTMRDAIAWSYDLLSDDEQALFRRISVFVGGASLQAVETVCDESLDCLASLVSKSLLRLEETNDGQPRYQMLETVREFGLERLAASGEMQAVRERHYDWMLSLFETHKVGDSSGLDAGWLDRVEQEIGNLRSALEFAAELEDPQRSMLLAAWAFKLWQFRGRRAEGRAWLNRAIARDSGAPTITRAYALEALGYLENSPDDNAISVIHLEESLGIARALGDLERIQYATWGLAATAIDAGRYDDRPMTLLEESARAAEARADKSGVAASLLYQGLLEHRRCELGRAERKFEAALDLYRAAGHKAGVSWSLWGLGFVAADRREYSRAAELYSETWQSMRLTGSIDELVWWLARMALLAAAAGQSKTAVRWFSTVSAHQERLGIFITEPEQRRYDETTNELRRGLDDASFSSNWEAGRSLSSDCAVAEALEFAANLVVAQSSVLQRDEPQSRLTTRETQVLTLVAEGMSDQEIAAAIFVTPGTVRSHLTNIFSKLDVGSRTGAIAAARHQGIL